jgi:hypothetical protein
MEERRNLILKFKLLRKMINKLLTDSNKCGIWYTKSKTMMESAEILMVINGEDHHQLWSIMYTKGNFKCIKRKPSKHLLSIKRLLKNTMH